MNDGKQCEVCNEPATHLYGTMWVCCNCHIDSPYLEDPKDKHERIIRFLIEANTSEGLHAGTRIIEDDRLVNALVNYKMGVKARYDA